MALKAALDLLDIHVDRLDVDRAHELIGEIRNRLREANADSHTPPSITARGWYQLALALGTTSAGTVEEAYTVLEIEVLPRAKYPARAHLYAACLAVRRGETDVAKGHFRQVVKVRMWDADDQCIWIA
eukprot:SAG31_NODE_1930_length_6881_cov_6.976998_9_plen_128_part_00